MSLKKDFEREHPSYGMLRLSRSMNSNTRRLFGSSLDAHYNTIRISVSSARWYHTLSEDRYYGSLKDHIEIELSAAQFAEAITSLNMGDGTPCTVRYVGGKEVPPPPDFDTESQHIKNSFRDELQESIAAMKKYRAEVDELTAALPAKKKERLRIALDCMIQQFESNTPFVLSQFEEATSRVVTSAKAEVEAFASNVLRAAGMEAIAQGRLPSLLGAGTEEEEHDPYFDEPEGRMEVCGNEMIRSQRLPGPTTHCTKPAGHKSACSSTWTEKDR